MIPEQTLPEDYSLLLKNYQELQEDYEQLKVMFENMGQGYEDALMLYDKAMESSRMKTDFIRQISHEIRTPLNILSGFTQILTSDLELDEAMKQKVTQGIIDNTQRIAGLVNKMLELAQASSGSEIERTDDVSAVQIAALAVDKSRIMEVGRLHFGLQTTPEVEMAMLHTNLQQAIRALELLLDNAMKFTLPAVPARSSEAVREPTHVLLSIRLVASAADETRQIAFIVEDNGIGVPPEEAEHIFEEFVQLNQFYEGMGIGLTVARSIARRLGGDVVLDSTYSEGARFVFTLPLT